MPHVVRIVCLLSMLAGSAAFAQESDAPRSRFAKARDLYDKYHPWQPPATKAEWEKEAAALRQQVLVSQGLWPMLPRTDLKAVVHGKIDRDEYTIEKVYFESLPGHFVTGNLYRPKKNTGKAPGVLCPHGHWNNGRFYDAGEKGAADQITQGAEKFDPGARHPLQARAVGLARLGCVVFHYDMEGYADSLQVVHRAGFTDVEAELRLQTVMGLQTWNSIRALDFITSLPDVDAERIGVTGASGGGTQTFMLTSVDPRPAAAFPAVMVSTNMQGGCMCENASYLRVGTNNIAIAALFAPKPMAMSGADDWTIDIETRGLPELKKIYGFYDKPDFVDAKCYPQFKHNYNQVAREMMYAWFNKHLGLNVPADQVAEREFKAVPIAELSVWDAEHPKPKGDTSDVRAYLTKVADEQFAALLPKDAAGVAEYRSIIGGAARTIIEDGVPRAPALTATPLEEKTAVGNATLRSVRITRQGSPDAIVASALVPEKPNGKLVLWFTTQGKKGTLMGEASGPAVAKLTDAGYVVASCDLYLTGDSVPKDKATEIKVQQNYAPYTFGYNRPAVVERARDILAVIGTARMLHPDQEIILVGTQGGGVPALLAASVAGDAVKRTVVDLEGFSFGKLKATTDPNMLPGGLKYGGIGGFAALVAPAHLTLAGAKDVVPEELRGVAALYRATEAVLELNNDSLTPASVADLLVKKAP